MFGSSDRRDIAPFDSTEQSPGLDYFNSQGLHRRFCIITIICAEIYVGKSMAAIQPTKFLKFDIEIGGL